MTRRLYPEGLVQVELTPGSVKHLAKPCACHQEKPDDVRGLFVLVPVTCSEETMNFRQIQMLGTLILREFLDALARIAGTNLVVYREVEHLAQASEKLICAI